MKRSTVLLGCAVLICATASQAKTPQQPIDPGPRPTDQEFVKKATQALLSSFFDPASAVIEWPYGLHAGYAGSKKNVGWWTCGRVNAKNRMGGYVGFRPFMAVMNNGSIIYTNVAESNGFSFVGAGCENALKTGLLPKTPLVTKAASEPVVAPAPATPVSGFASMLGLQFSDDANGVRIEMVTPGSVADAAGLKAGIVIQKVNGVSLASLEFGIKAKLFEAADAGATLTNSDGLDILMRRPAPAPTQKINKHIQRTRR
jgi:hypothetical protein